jgi:hypothetical protein
MASILSTHPQNKNPCCYLTTLSKSYCYEKEDMGYKRKNKRHAQVSMMKREADREREEI